MRTAQVTRKTKETDITVSLSLDGGGVAVETGIGFFDHILTALAVHAGFGLELHMSGDLEVDCHHTVEDTGIALGAALAKALGDRTGIARYGTFFLPMDESLAHVSLDLSNRPVLGVDAAFSEERVGAFDTCTFEEFLRAFAVNGGITLHARCLYGSNSHHQIEAMAKALGHALKAAVTPAGDAVLSTKGCL
ncbi:MAG: imidazoleglycerol-phosphate dehydratase HisB [Clostridiales bacterium]|nr:imidazoleglycerol-phosphate dehydratase HisB [Clostridiales bacterium]